MGLRLVLRVGMVRLRAGMARKLSVDCWRQWSHVLASIFVLSHTVEGTSLVRILSRVYFV